MPFPLQGRKPYEYAAFQPFCQSGITCKILPQLCRVRLFRRHEPRPALSQGLVCREPYTHNTKQEDDKTMASINTMAAPGQLNGQGLTDAQFLKIFTGEILTAFDENNIMKSLHRERTITQGKSASFPTMWKANARYHKAGTPILGSNKILHGERIIHIDDLLTADVFLYDLDEAKNHYDIRGEYSKQLGAALAREYDQTTMRVACLAARSAGPVTGAPGGSTLTNAAYANDGKKLAEGIFLCAQTFDEKDVPDSDRVVIVKPAQYYLLAQTTDLINKDWGGSGVYADGKILKVANIRIIKSNNVPNSVVVSRDGEKNDYTGDFSKTVAVCFTRDALGTVKLRDLKVEKTGGDFAVVYQGTLIVAKYAMGHGVLRSECAIELTSA